MSPLERAWHDRMTALLAGDREASCQAFAEGQSGFAWHQLHVGRDFDALRESAPFRELARPKN